MDPDVLSSHVCASSIYYWQIIESLLVGVVLAWSASRSLNTTVMFSFVIFDEFVLIFYMRGRRYCKGYIYHRFWSFGFSNPVFSCLTVESNELKLRLQRMSIKFIGFAVANDEKEMYQFVLKNENVFKGRSKFESKIDKKEKVFKGRIETDCPIQR
ncbi:unnamed protein product [Thlaspi arvense]|uniref:Uncharacterized protein n=1 Tax=Thlaspi arvense TaxID=13288 RepID=A0AAU9SAS9_THLAR|nr:unnamed protein product [Thlaspi arvense]